MREAVRFMTTCTSGAPLARTAWLNRGIDFRGDPWCPWIESPVTLQAMNGGLASAAQVLHSSRPSGTSHIPGLVCCTPLLQCPPDRGMNLPTGVARSVAGGIRPPQVNGEGHLSTGTKEGVCSEPYISRSQSVEEMGDRLFSRRCSDGRSAGVP